MDVCVPRASRYVPTWVTHGSPMGALMAEKPALPHSPVTVPGNLAFRFTLPAWTGNGGRGRERQGERGETPLRESARNREARLGPARPGPAYIPVDTHLLISSWRSFFVRMNRRGPRVSFSAALMVSRAQTRVWLSL